MIQDKKVIYVNGDSFTEGCELSNHLCVGAFDRYYSLEDIINWGAETEEKQTKSVRSIQKYHKENPNCIPALYDYENEKRWSNQLELLLGRRVINSSSMGGSGIYEIAYKTIMDVTWYMKHGFEFSHVIIQVTSPYRFSLFKTTSPHEEPRRVNAVPPPCKYNIVGRNYATENFVNEIEDTAWQVYRYVHDLYMFTQTIKQITDATLIFVDSLFYKPNFISKEGVYLIPNCDGHVLEFKQTLDEKIQLSMLDCVDRFEPDSMTGGLHFTEKIHSRFAKSIAERYF